MKSSQENSMPSASLFPDFRLIFNALPHIIVIKDKDLRWVYANEAAISAFNLQDTNWQFHTNEELFPDTFAPILQKHDLLAKNSHKPLTHFEKLPKATETHNPIFSVRRQRWTDPNGNVFLLCTYEETNQIFSLINENIREVIIVTDHNAIISHISPSILKVSGFSAEEVLGVYSFEIIHPNDRAKVLDQFGLQLTGSSPEEAEGEMEVRIKHKTKGWIWVAMSSICIRSESDRTNYQFLSVLRDISIQKQTDQSLRTKVQELDEKNQELERYIASNMKLEHFAHVAAHDLKEPLRTIGNFTQLLARRYKDQLDEGGQEFIQFITEGVTDMKQLIDDLLLYARFDSDKSDREEVDPTALIKSTCESIFRTIREKNAKIQISKMPARIMAYRTMLKQLFQNLIVNALKFSRPEVAPIVRIEGVDKGDFWEFSVADNGIGIAPKHQERIFLLFQKLHSRHEYSGTGIGLALCKKIAEHHGGDILVQSNPEMKKGSTFYFTIKKSVVLHG